MSSIVMVLSGPAIDNTWPWCISERAILLWVLSNDRMQYVLILNVLFSPAYLSLPEVIEHASLSRVLSNARSAFGSYLPRYFQSCALDLVVCTRSRRIVTIQGRCFTVLKLGYTIEN